MLTTPIDQMPDDPAYLKTVITGLRTMVRAAEQNASIAYAQGITEGIAQACRAAHILGCHSCDRLPDEAINLVDLAVLNGQLRKSIDDPATPITHPAEKINHTTITGGDKP